jgi:hypothetical protein
MTKFKKDNIWVIFGIIALVVLIGRTGFIGTFITTCENNEPADINGYSDSISSLNGSFSQTEQIPVEIGVNNTVILQEYHSESTIGSLDMVGCAELECDDVLDIFKLTKNGSYVTLNGKNVLSVNSGDREFYWCNKGNTVLLNTGSIETFSNYWSQYEVCTTEEVIEDENVTEEASSGGSMSTSTTFSEGSEDTSEGISKNKKIATVIFTTALIIFVIYWFFEKGPKKGLFKKKRK